MEIVLRVAYLVYLLSMDYVLVDQSIFSGFGLGLRAILSMLLRMEKGSDVGHSFLMLLWDLVP
jgi:hypothetical protein